MNPRNALICLVLVAVFFLGVLAGGYFLSKPALERVVPGKINRSGQELINQGSVYFNDTQRHLGQAAASPANRYIQAGLNCSSCHVNGGIDPFFLNLQGVAARYPRISPRNGKTQTLADRINGCMERSMNGKPLPEGSHPLRAMTAYLSSLPAPGKSDWVGHETTNSAGSQNSREGFKVIDRAADLGRGQKLYVQHCASCHGTKGEGVLTPYGERPHFMLPPLWGPHSFNDGAGMARLMTAAKFVYQYMPQGNPTLTVEESYDVAAYMLSQPRPQASDAALDYRNLLEKPVDAAYPPYLGPFPEKQRRLGPFGPMLEYVKQHGGK
ncbi:MAG: c-type cytochrome [Verrucomicrobiae bacterium]|nr:c-type cytochrome [Verrucomicrobiae bacterium]